MKGILQYITTHMKNIITMLMSFLSLPAFAGHTDSLDFKIGQMIMIGVEDRTAVFPGDPLLMEIRDGKLGGVIIFEKNLTKNKSYDNLKLLIQNLQKEAPIPLFVTIDEEGGKVHRLKAKYGFFDVPSAAYLGRI